jgi:hypothetical protein
LSISQAGTAAAITIDSTGSNALGETGIDITTAPTSGYEYGIKVAATGTGGGVQYKYGSNILTSGSADRIWGSQITAGGDARDYIYGSQITAGNGVTTQADRIYGEYISVSNDGTPGSNWLHGMYISVTGAADTGTYGIQLDNASPHDTTGVGAKYGISSTTSGVAGASTYAGYFANTATDGVTASIKKYGLYVTSTGAIAGAGTEN